MITLSRITKAFPHQGRSLPILNIPHWEVRKGQRIALLGPSGSGKSTLLHLIGGVIEADSGELKVAEYELHLMKEAARDAYRASHVGYMFQDFYLIPSLTARQNVELVMNAGQSKKETQQLLVDWFERVGLREHMNHLPSQLSRGQQQRVAMIRALINLPKLVLADEPTGSLDYESAAQVMRLLLTICEQEGLTLIVVTHDQHLAEWFPEQVRMEELNALLPITRQAAIEAGTTRDNRTVTRAVTMLQGGASDE